MFYHLRNSLAHARFCIKEIKEENNIVRYYIFQDGMSDKKGFKISARMILREDTLIKWADLIESGEQPYNKEN